LSSSDAYTLLEHKWNSSRYLSIFSNPLKGSDDEETRKKSSNYDGKFSKIIWGNQVEFDLSRRIAKLTDSSVIGKSGESIALTNIAIGLIGNNHPSRDVEANTEVRNDDNHFGMLADALARKCRHENSSTFYPMTVDYRQRHHAVGKIPTSANRTDNRRPTDSETLASRAIDRSLRPLLRKDSFSNKSSNDVSSIHISCSIQAYKGGHPVSLALNSAAIALKDRLSEPVAAIALCLMEDGTVLVNPSVASIHSQQQQLDQNSENKGVVGNLLYAGTKESIVMMEFSGLLPESMLLDLIGLAHECIQPIIKTQENMLNLSNSEKDEANQKFQDDNELRNELGLAIEKEESNSTIVTFSEPIEESEFENKADQIYDEAIEFVVSRLRDASLRLFGVHPGDEVEQTNRSTKTENIAIHSEDVDGALLGKFVRGRRESLVNEEIRRVLAQFEPSNSQLSKDYHKLLHHNKSIIQTLGDTIHSQILREAMKDSSIKYKCRADGRGSDATSGSCTIRPLSIDVPALPDAVHGSALFTRGETQVLCTTTLGPPKDGILQNDPYEPTTETLDKANDVDTPSKKLPVGSLRYLRSQEHLESDLNSRKVRADREQTGDSGTLRERRRAFLQYDFPAYSKGEIQIGPTGANRREIGHSALAEKSILPTLPPAKGFPYAIRMTSEVTSSNGSSSMATVCGVTLSLLDAGVPISAPAAGVSVGLVQDATDNSHQLLLDITGTEDHFGLMDFKVAGTAEKVTAMQLDVKQPLSLSVITDALHVAKEGRVAILDEMKAQSKISSKGAISNLSHRSELKPSAPRSSVVTFDPARKKDLLGPGGVVIRQMEDRFNVSLDLTQEGQCLLFGDDREMVRKAKAAVMDLVSDVEVGVTYEGTIIEIRDFGVIIELLRNKEGLCHVSEFAVKEKIKSHPHGTLGVLNELFVTGQNIDVVCTAVDPVQGIIRLRPASKKESF
jgi:polyribonucleotide nucleotidyltransferase